MTWLKVTDTRYELHVDGKLVGTCILTDRGWNVRVCYYGRLIFQEHYHDLLLAKRMTEVASSN